MINWDVIKIGKKTEELVADGLRGYARQDYQTFYLCLGELLRRASKNGKKNAVRAARYLTYLVLEDQVAGVVKPAEQDARGLLFRQSADDDDAVISERRAELLKYTEREPESETPELLEVDRASAGALSAVVSSTPIQFETGWCRLCLPRLHTPVDVGVFVCEDHS